MLESCFGKSKQLKIRQSRGGFTRMLLEFGAMLTDGSMELVRRAMQASRTIDVRRWAAQTLGVLLGPLPRGREGKKRG